MNTSSKKRSSRAKTWVPMLLIAGIAVVAGVFAGNLKLADTDSEGRENHELSSIQDQLQNSLLFPDDFKSVPEFSLLQGTNEPLTQADLKGKWSVIFFGFTNCPDVCPVTLAEMNSAVTQLAEDSVQAPQVIFITVDPVRDTVEKMAEYVAYFNEEFIGGSGELTDITVLTRKLGIVASYTASDKGDNTYSVDHTASMLVIDPELRVRAKLNPPHKADTIVADLKTLLVSFN